MKKDVRAIAHSQEQVTKQEVPRITWLRKVLYMLFDFTSSKPSNVVDPFEHERRDWEAFYEVVFNIDCDFSSLHIPEKPNGQFFLIIVLEGLTCNCVFDHWNFPKFKWNGNKGDIDDSVAKNIRTTRRNYAIWVRNSQEADDENLVMQFRQSIKGPRSGMTLLERMLFESKYFYDTGKHLDNTRSTLCSGSTFKDGKSPHIFCGSNGKVRVHTCDRDGSPRGKDIRVVISG